MKRMFDIVGCIVLFPILLIAALGLLIANPRWNRGRLFFVQKRMGLNCKPIRVIKFRSMVDVSRIRRRADDPLETHRITKLGRFIRIARVDELPQILNVLRGEMSLIGPRPDYFPHALHYLRTIPGYQRRHDVLPGITGLAQVTNGYAASVDETRAKVASDLRYVREQGVLMELRITIATLITVLRGGGS